MQSRVGGSERVGACRGRKEKCGRKISRELLKQKQNKATKRAERFRLKGNKSYAAGDLSSAEGYYAEAILLLESSGMGLIDKNHLTLRTNRAAALMALGRDNDALQECLNVLNVDEENIKALSQAAQRMRYPFSNLNSARKYIARIVLSFDSLSRRFTKRAPTTRNAAPRVHRTR